MPRHRQAARLDGRAAEDRRPRPARVRLLQGVRAGDRGRPRQVPGEAAAGEPPMIGRVIDWSIRHRLAVILATAAMAAWGAYAALVAPIDAIPDLSENQVIVHA